MCDVGNIEMINIKKQKSIVDKLLFLSVIPGCAMPASILNAVIIPSHF